MSRVVNHKLHARLMTTQTQTGAYLKKMANGGHFKQKLGETARGGDNARPAPKIVPAS